MVACRLPTSDEGKKSAATLVEKAATVDLGVLAKALPFPVNVSEAPVQAVVPVVFERVKKEPGHPQARPQMTRLNDFAWVSKRLKQSDKAELGKRVARTCTKPTSGHNFTFGTRAHYSRERPRPNDQPERVHMDALK